MAGIVLVLVVVLVLDEYASTIDVANQGGWAKLKSLAIRMMKIIPIDTD